MKEQKRDTTSFALYIGYRIILVAAVVLVLRILYIQLLWKPDEEIAGKLRLPKIEKVTEPVRGNILDCNGRPLAMSYPRYEIYIDCGACAADFKRRAKKLSKNVQEDSIRVWEARWRDDVRELSKGMARIFNIQGKDADYYSSVMINGYKKVRYKKIGRPLERSEYLELKEYPLIRRGRYAGGVWAETVPTRRYPYGNLARRTIGSVRESKDTASYVGIDGKFNSILHGEPGREILKLTDYGYVRDYDSTLTPARNGKDVRTTLNIDYQEIADRNLRSAVENDHDIEAACCVLMEVKTGAIRAMVNLSRNKESDTMGEIESVCISRLGEPGSVFKLSTLMTLLEGGYIHSMSDKVFGNDGLIEGYPYKKDQHVLDYKKEYHSNMVPLWYGVMVSANQPFRKLVIDNFESNPEAFMQKVIQYKFADPMELDVAEKMPQPYVPYPGKEKWSKVDLGQVAIGYAVNVTPMHILTFYNAIANKGKMMKPYLVESIEENGKEVEHLGPSILSGAICRQEVADTLINALTYPVNKKGTAAALLNAKCNVVGKTGTSRISMSGSYQSGETFRNQGTFVGIFPKEDPQYTIICCVYSRPTKKSFYGSVIPANTVTRIVNELYTTDPYFYENI